METARGWGFPVYPVRASISTAVHRVLAKTHRDVPLIVRWLPFLYPCLRQSPSDTVNDLLAWL